ncbi:hypothetical protein [Emticicia sp. W12TSBA100-4]|uniref:hypothetical protein n=1 Tax=Emticicia sp. W12TSBA100-4 TaxID=3160965 RepID=UPI003305DC89
MQGLQFDIHENLTPTVAPPTPKKAVPAVKKKAVSQYESEGFDDTTRTLAHMTTTATIKPHSITVSTKFQAVKRNEVSNKNLLQESDRNGVYNGYLSPNTKREIKKRLDNWLTAISENVDFKNAPKSMNRNQVYPTFVTLTLPSKQVHKDTTIKDRCFLPFVEWLCNQSQELDRKGNLKGCGVNGYFWRAESTKGGNIHFHLIIDRFVNWDRLRKKWNQFIERLGYVTRYKNRMQAIYADGFVLNTKQQSFEVKRLKKIADAFNETGKLPKRCHKRLMKELEECQRLNRKITQATLLQVSEGIQSDAYFAGKFDDWKNPNSTDIKKVDNIGSLASYVCKYVAKDAETAPLLANQKVETIDGKKWLITTTLEDGWVIESEKIEFKPVFLIRKVGGRLWGCSDNLRQKEVEYPKYEILQEERVMDNDPKAVQKFYTRTLEKDETVIECIETVKAMRKQNLTITVKGEKKTVKKIEENRINDFCITYSSRLKMKDVVTAPIKDKYNIHYRNLFNHLYYGSTT